MKAKMLFVVSAVLVLSGCTSIRLNKEGGDQASFEKDRYACLKESSNRVDQGHANAQGSQYSSQVKPDISMYLACMNSHGWHRVSEGGFVPDLSIY